MSCCTAKTSWTDVGILRSDVCKDGDLCIQMDQPWVHHLGSSKSMESHPKDFDFLDASSGTGNPLFLWPLSIAKYDITRGY